MFDPTKTKYILLINHRGLTRTKPCFGFAYALKTARRFISAGASVVEIRRYADPRRAIAMTMFADGRVTGDVSEEWGAVIRDLQSLVDWSREYLKHWTVS